MTKAPLALPELVTVKLCVGVTHDGQVTELGPTGATVTPAGCDIGALHTVRVSVQTGLAVLDTAVFPESDVRVVAAWADVACARSAMASALLNPTRRPATKNDGMQRARARRGANMCLDRRRETVGRRSSARHQVDQPRRFAKPSNS